MFVFVLSGQADVAAQAKRQLVVTNDRGGFVVRRAGEVDRLRRARQAVAIRGNVCLSSCTMYLGAGDVCVSRETAFGFHGPRLYDGRPLTADDFEFYSWLIAQYYPPGLQDWYIETGRHRIRGFYWITGARLIAMGFSEC